MTAPAPVPALTGLRFVAAFCVFLSHALPTIVPIPGDLPWWYVFVSRLAGIGMPLFFVLSGFVIHYNYRATVSDHGARGKFNFFVARFARLYPLFLFGLAYDLLYKFGYAQLPDTTGQALPWYLLMVQTWFYRVLGAHALTYQFGLMPSVAWSISTEWFFYCAYPFLCLGLVCLRTPRRVLIAMLLLVVCAFLLVATVGYQVTRINAFAVAEFGPLADWETSNQDSFIRWLLYFSPYSRILEFCLGCLVAEIHMQLRSRPAARERMVGAFLTPAAVLLVLYVYGCLNGVVSLSPLPDELRAPFADTFGMAPAIGLLIFCCVRYQTPIVGLLSRPTIVLLGEVSYSLYMFHLVVIEAFRWETSPVAEARVYVSDFLRLAIVTGCSIGLAFVSWRAIEVPARRWLRRKLTLPLTERAAAVYPAPAE